MKTALTVFTLSLLLLIACRKDSFITSPDASVSITADTLHYDTVFTSVGSVTQTFRIINENNQKLRLSSVRLMGGTASNFMINVNGEPTALADNIEIEANDSIHVFVKVTVDPSSENLPFIIRDSIEIVYNGKTRWVQLEAWGQNAHFFRNRLITSDENWTNDLPYVIQGFLYVDAGQTLTIEKGSKIYMHADAPMIVDGSLKVNGEKDTADRVYFMGDRLDLPYREYPASWPGIYFREGSRDNVLNYAVIKNAYQSIAVENPSVNSNPKLVLNECIIDNSYDAGIIALNSSIKARNCLISNCGKNIVIGRGGDYEFEHCTVVSYSNLFIQHKDPVLTLSNSDGTATAPLKALFRNCIFWGDDGSADNKIVENEVLVKSGAGDQVVFDHNLWRVTSPPSNITANGNINQQPMFDSIDVSKRIFDFRFNKDASPALDAGTASPVNIDLDGNPRPVGVPDLGCFEKQ